MLEAGLHPNLVFNALNQSTLLTHEDLMMFMLDTERPLPWKQVAAGSRYVLVHLTTHAGCYGWAAIQAVIVSAF